MWTKWRRIFKEELDSHGAGDGLCSRHRELGGLLENSLEAVMASRTDLELVGCLGVV